MPRLLLILLLFCCVAGSGHAAAGAWQRNDQVAVRLISGVTATGDLATLPLGLEVRLAPGWKTYWRTPGTAGQPPQFDWPAEANPNLAQFMLHFPAPERHFVGDIETIGYQDTVIFPLSITPKTIGAALPLTAKLTILTCAELCIPQDFTLQLTLPAGTATPSAESELLAAAQAHVPLANALSIKSATQDAKGQVTLAFTAPEELQAPDAFVETVEGGIFMPPQITLNKDGRSGTLRFTAQDGRPRLRPLSLTVTLADGGKGWDGTTELAPPQDAPMPLVPANTQTQTGAPSKTALIPPLPQPPPVALGLLGMMLLALLGGLILNLMPCVLPVLSLKVLKFFGHGGRDNAAARRSFMLAAAGILVSFLAIAAALLLLRAGGATIGWGIQFQHPVFLLFLISVLLAFAANLWGWFEFRLPDRLNQRLATLGSHDHDVGDFLSGAFATLLATPCTAPFLGTAVGFALGSDAAVMLGIFTSMGLGMALPYLLVAAFPALATKMPKPGAWMKRLRQLLGFALFATALWLGYVLLVPWLPQERDQRWQPFVEAVIADKVATGHVVFVDVTASWCATCQTNKQLVLYQSPVQERLFGGKIIAMQADWTKPDPAIAAYLKSFSRAGIPFNAVYGPGAPQGLVLPELLTASAVLQALDKAAGSP